jgi:Zinc knuckle
MSAAPYTAPSTRNRTRDPEQGVQTPSSGTQIVESIETMSANQLTDAQQLAAAREQVRQLQEQLDEARTASQRSTPSLERHPYSSTVKLKDPEPLTDGASPSFENWRIQIEDKFLINGRMFDSEQAKMAYIFNRTADIAQKHLAPRYRKGPEPFTSAAEMITYLAEILENPFEAQDARIDFRKLSMREDESFSDFYTRFLHLAGMGKIPTDDLQPDLYDKLTPSLQQSVLPFLDTLLTSKALAHKCLLIDKNLRRLQLRRNQLRTARLTARSATTSSTVRQPATISPSPAAVRMTSPTPAPKLYGPTRESTPVRKDPEDACFRCKQLGHFARDCPEPPRPRTDVKELAEPAPDSSSDSEKDQA